MRAYLLSLSLLGVVAACLSTSLEAWFQNWQGNRTSSDNLLQVALGDSRKLFARHFFSKADAYLHKGYYPTIFDAAGPSGQSTPGNALPSDGNSNKCEGDFLGQPRDWIDQFRWAACDGSTNPIRSASGASMIVPVYIRRLACPGPIRSTSSFTSWSG